MPKRESTTTPEERPSKKVKILTGAELDREIQLDWLKDLQDDLTELIQENARMELTEKGNESKITEMKRLISALRSCIDGGTKNLNSKFYYIVRSNEDDIDGKPADKRRNGNIKGIYNDLNAANQAAVLEYKNLRYEGMPGYPDWNDYPVTDYGLCEKPLESFDLKDGETIRATMPDGTHLFKFRDDKTYDGWVTVTPYECNSVPYVKYLAEYSMELPWDNSVGTGPPSLPGDNKKTNLTLRT